MAAYNSELEDCVVQVALRVLLKGMVPYEGACLLVLGASGVAVGGLQEVFLVLVAPYVQGSGGFTYVLVLYYLILFYSQIKLVFLTFLAGSPVDNSFSHASVFALLTYGF